MTVEGNIVIQDQQATTLTIGDNLVKFDMASGEMTFGDAYTPEDAAKVFWDAVASMIVQRIAWMEEGKCWLCGQDEPA